MRAGGLVVLGVLARVAHADVVLDKPSFTATPSELIAAANVKPAGATDAFIMREDEDVAFDDKGRVTTHWHMIFVVTSQAGADDWGTVGAGWIPAYQDKPTVKARVIDPSAKVTELDQGRITEAASWPNTLVPGARRQLEGVLPRLQVGSIVEEEVVTTDREPLIGGAIESFRWSGSVPVVSARVVVSAPAKRKLNVVARNIKLKPKLETTGGRQRMTYTTGPFPVDDEVEPYTPSDLMVGKYLQSTVTESWSAVARDYRAVLEKKLAEGPATLPPDIGKTASVETAAAIVAWVHRTVKYDDIELGEADIVPATPSETLKRGQGDAKDKALLIVSALRHVGMTAELALVDDGIDLERTTPGMSMFGAVLVHARVGTKEIWIEPTDASERIGVVPPTLQGRQALIIADTTTGLTRTPQSSMKDNTSSETRTFEIAEHGHPKVTEVSQSTGGFEAEDRSAYRDGTSDKLRKHLETYVGDEYHGAKLDQVLTSAADDFTKPFTLTLVTSGTKRAYTDRDDGYVYLFATPVLERLPHLLGEPDEQTRVRKHDLWLRMPFTTVVENRIAIPDGFALPTPDADQTRDLGPLKLIVQQKLDGRTFVVAYRLEVPKQQLTPGEVTTVQDSIRALRNEKGLRIQLDTTSKALADSGKYQAAVAEAQRMIALHPKEALHHMQLALLFLNAGAGEAARRDAKKATELEASNADAFAVLGWVLAHDTFGKVRGFDYDRDGAIGAYQKAHKLDPKHVGAAVELARMLERAPSGRKYDIGSDLKGAIAAWHDALALDDSDEKASGLARSLLVSGDAAQAETLLRPRSDTEDRNGLLVAAMAMGKPGAKAAFAAASSLASGQARGKIVATVALTLMAARKYDELRAFMAEAGPTKDARFDQILKVLRRSETVAKPAAPAEQAALDAELTAITGTKSVAVFLDKRVAEEITKASASDLASLPVDVFTSVVLEDLVRSAASTKSEVEGSITHVEIDTVGTKSYVFVLADKTKTKVFGSDDAPQGVGRQILAMLQRNDEKTPLRILDWMAADLSGSKKTFGQVFPLLWGAGMPRTRQAIELAAAVLTADSDYARTQSIMKRCGATSKEGQIVCDVVLADALKKAANWSELAEVAEAWMTRLPKNELPVRARVNALLHLGQLDQAEQVLTDARKDSPDDEKLVSVQVEIDFARAKPAQAVIDAETLATKSNPTAYGLNEAAWTRFVTNSDLPNARLEARRSITMQSEYPQLNTIAAIDAEVGELKDAHEHLAESMRIVARDSPLIGDWFVHGRILEQLGLRDDAIAAYRKAHLPTHDSFMVGSEDLAKARLKALGVK